MSTASEDRVGAIPPLTLPIRLVMAREFAGMNQRELAAALDISLRTINRYEAGDKPKRVTILGWAFACGVNATWLETGIAPYTGTSTTGASDCYPVPYRAA